MAQWTRRQVLAQMGLAAAAVHTLDPHELCCTVAAHAQTAEKDLFELKKVGDGVYGAIAATRYKVNCNAAVIMTDDGVVVVDSHSKPSASRAMYAQLQGGESYAARISTDGTVTYLKLPSYAWDIVRGPDGAAWFTGVSPGTTLNGAPTRYFGVVGRLGPSGVTKQFTYVGENLLVPASSTGLPRAAGPTA